MTTNQIELALVRHIDKRTHFIVPNIYFGLGFMYELDLLIVMDSGWATEIEIKTNISDLKAEKRKKDFAHRSNRIKYVYFAIPKTLLEKALPLIKERYGIYTVDEFGRVKKERSAKKNKQSRKLNDKELIKLGKLASMRMWTLKERINK